MKFCISTIILFAVVLLLGCTKKAPESIPAPAPVNTAVTDVMLAAGTGAVMVVHPEPHRFDREKWMIQILLEGDSTTDKLPVVPLADVQSGVVLDVPPGTYKVISSAWVRKYPVTSGGALDNVAVNAGEVVMLQAQDVRRDEHPYDKTSLQILDRHRWTLTSREQFNDFLSALIRNKTQN